MLDGGTAFPSHLQFSSLGNCSNSDAELTGGMSLRDWFAGQALAGLCGCQDFVNEICKACESKEQARAIVAFHAYKQADAMLVARDRLDDPQ
jgi:hypothetical protein